MLRFFVGFAVLDAWLTVTVLVASVTGNGYVAGAMLGVAVPVVMVSDFWLFD
jgi:uncharacterized membrane protein